MQSAHEAITPLFLAKAGKNVTLAPHRRDSCGNARLSIGLALYGPMCGHQAQLYGSSSAAPRVLAVGLFLCLSRTGTVFIEPLPDGERTAARVMATRSYPLPWMIGIAGVLVGRQLRFHLDCLRRE